MNITEVYMLNSNLGQFYDMYEYPSLPVQIGDYRWYLIDNKVKGDYYSYISQYLSEWLFSWVGL